jgi:hypothetical protein
MSIGVIHELTRACLEKFKKMANDIPKSEKKHVIKVFEKHVKILEGI